MSAVGDRSVGNRALAEGATGFVAKPFGREAFTITLEDALKHHRLASSYASTSTVV